MRLPYAEENMIRYKTETRQTDGQNSYDNWKHCLSNGLRRIVTLWLLRLINTLTYLLAYLVFFEAGDFWKRCSCDVLFSRNKNPSTQRTCCW